MDSSSDTDPDRPRIGRRLQRFAFAGAALTVVSCMLAAPHPRAQAAARTGSPVHAAPLTIVVVTLDGVRWHEVFEGVDAKLAAQHGMPPSSVVGAAELMPNLHAIIDTHGVALGAPGHGSPIVASGPHFVSLPGYAELLSGRSVTACKDNQCAGSDASTLVDELSDLSPLEGRDVALVTSWSEIARVASRASCQAAISSGRHGGATRQLFGSEATGLALLALGENANPAPGNGDFRPDALTADLAIHHLQAHAPRFLFVGLGEPDEFGHAGNYAGYLASLRAADTRIAEIERALQDLAARGTRTALFITADHGRADGFVEHGKQFPESARVWLVATGSTIEKRGFVSAPRERFLADLAPTVRKLAGLPVDHDAHAGTPLTELLGPAASL